MASLMTYNAVRGVIGGDLTLSLMGSVGDLEDPRLKQALRIFKRVEKLVGRDEARAWMIGGNPALGDDTPITAIREGRFSEVEAAAANHLAT